MKVWVSTKIEGHYPVGTAVVVVAENEEQACAFLENELAAHGLPQAVTPDMLERVPLGLPGALVLNDGNY